MSLTNPDRKIQSDSENIFGSLATEIAGALHRQFDGHRGGIRNVVALTGANERTVRNWFEAKNGPSGELLVLLCRHSDQVLSTVMKLAGRTAHARSVSIAIAAQRAHELCRLLDDLGGE